MEAITDNDLALFRERAKTELKSTGDIGRLAWDDVVEALCKEVARLRSVSKERGDCAKLREALTKVKEWMEHRIATCGFEASATFPTMLEDVVLPVLAAPPRNCDVYTADELKVKFNSELDSELPIANEHEKNLVTITATGVIDTLFATTQKGGNDAD